MSITSFSSSIELQELVSRCISSYWTVLLSSCLNLDVKLNRLTLETGELFGGGGDFLSSEIPFAGLSPIREFVGTTRSLFSIVYLVKFQKNFGHLNTRCSFVFSRHSNDAGKTKSWGQNPRVIPLYRAVPRLFTNFILEFTDLVDPLFRKNDTILKQNALWYYEKHVNVV